MEQQRHFQIELIFTTFQLEVGALQFSRPRFALAATSIGNLVLFGGGLSFNGYSNLIDMYNVSSNTWTTATLSQARFYLASTSVANRFALFAGGDTGSGVYSNVVDIFDYLSGQWSTSTLSQPRRYLTSTSLRELAFFAVDKLIENKHRMLLISSTQQLKHGTLQH
jgi:hypothetical protein